VNVPRQHSSGRRHSRSVQPRWAVRRYAGTHSVHRTAGCTAAACGTGMRQCRCSAGPMDAVRLLTGASVMSWRAGRPAAALPARSGRVGSIQKRTWGLLVPSRKVLLACTGVGGRCPLRPAPCPNGAICFGPPGCQTLFVHLETPVKPDSAAWIARKQCMALSWRSRRAGAPLRRSAGPGCKREASEAAGLALGRVLAAGGGFGGPLQTWAPPPHPAAWPAVTAGRAL
jgi:hypothetical protein